jgi:DNA-binding beta-propeller fold protein YncE
MIDQAKDLAYLTDDSNVCIYVLENISTINGTVTPSRTIKVNNNELDGCKGLGVENDKLYVCSTIGGSIIVIGNASTASGSVDPERIITASDGLFNGPVAIALDPINKMMYVSNRSNDKVFAFKNYSSLNGTVTPAYYIYGDSTQLKTPVYLFVDPTRDN